MHVINQILQEQQGIALSNWTGFSDEATTRAKAEEAIKNTPKRFHYKPKGVPQAKPLLTKGVPTQLSESMGLLSGGEANSWGTT